MANDFLKEAIILQDDFSTFPDASTVCNLRLTGHVLYVDYMGKNKPDEDILINDMMGCRVLKNRNKSKEDGQDNCAYLTIYSYSLKTYAGILSKQTRRERKVTTFQMCKLDSLDENLKAANKWQVAISSLIRGISLFKNEKIHIPNLLPPPRKLLILINPKSGPGRAYHVFKERIVPLIEESDTTYELLVTDRRNCGRDYVKKANLSELDGIVIISGDGLLFEVYNGLMSRPDWQEAVKMPIGVIPGGSGNGLAKSLSHAAGEPDDAAVIIPYVLNIVHGKSVPMDLVKVTTEKESLYSFLSVGWGIMADIDIESERWRSIGEARFTVWGVIRALGLRKYKGRLSYLPVEDYNPLQTSKVVSEPRPKRSKTIDCHLAWSTDSGVSKPEDNDHSIFRSKSYAAEDSQLEPDKDVRLLKFSYSGEEFHAAPYDTPTYKSLVGKTEIIENVCHDHCQEGLEGESSEEPVKMSSHSLCPPLGSPVPEDWVVIEDEFVLAYACHQTHLSNDVYFAPQAKMDDGIMWLVMIRGNVSRAQVLYFLASLQSGEHVNLPCAECIPVHAFRLEPSTSDGFLTVDGEVISVCTIQAEVLPSIARVMSRLP